MAIQFNPNRAVVQQDVNQKKTEHSAKQEFVATQASKSAVAESGSVIAGVTKKLASEPAVDMERVEAIKAAIAKGDFTPDNAKIANKLMEMLDRSPEEI